MGGGCFSPRPLDGDLAIKLINEIHQEAVEVKHSSSGQAYEDKEHYYQELKQKVFRKSSVKKLMDYLACHRSRISQISAYNYRISMQNEHSHARATGLAILQRIIRMAMLPGGIQSKTGQTTKDNALKSKAGNSCAEESESKRTETLQTNRMDKENIQASCQIPASYEFIRTEILSRRFEITVVSMISGLLNEEKLYKQALEILINYYSLTNSNFLYEDKVIQILESLISNIRTTYQLKMSLRAYYVLINKMKDKTVRELINDLRYFVDFWLDCQGKMRSSKSLKNIEKTGGYLQTCEMIISRFIISTLGGEYSSVYQLLIELYDKNKFQGIQDLQNFIISVLKNNDMGQQFLRGFFLQILNYGLMGAIKGRRSQLPFVSKLTNQTSKWKHISQAETRLQVFRLIHRWIILQEHIQLQKIINYYSTFFLQTFLYSICYTSNKLFGSKVNQIFMQIVLSAKVQQKIVLVQRLYEQYMRRQQDSYIRVFGLNTIKKIYDGIEDICLDGEVIICSMQVEQLTIQEIYLYFMSMMEVMGKFQLKSLIKHTQQICKLLASICLYLNEDSETKAQMSKNLVIQTLLFCDKLKEIDNLLRAFFQKINRIIKNQSYTSCSEAYFKKLFEGLKGILNNVGAGESVLKQQDLYDSRSQKFMGKSQSDRRQFAVCKQYFRDFLNLASILKPMDEQSRENANFDKMNSIIRDNFSQQQPNFREIMDILNV